MLPLHSQGTAAVDESTGQGVLIILRVEGFLVNGYSWVELKCVSEG